MGGYSTLEFLRTLLKDERTIERMELNENKIDLIGKAIDIVEYITYHPILKVLIVILAVWHFVDISDFPLISFIEMLCNEIVINGYGPVFLNDTFVNLKSQLGKDDPYTSGIEGFKGFTNYTKCFRKYNFDPMKVGWHDEPPIVHNLETLDRDMVMYILRNIEMRGNRTFEYITYSTGANTVGISGYLTKYGFANFIIPSQIDGKTVTEIGNSAFSNVFTKEESVKTITIPNTITKIGDAAFENCDGIEQIIFSPSSNLELIGNAAFNNCSKITSFAFPELLIGIGDEVFNSCTELKSLNINSELEFIGANPFIGVKLEEITFNSSNQYFEVEKITNKSLTLYTKNKSELIYSNATGIFNVSNAVQKIRSHAFSSSENLTGVNLSKVRVVEDLAFVNTSLSTVNGGNDITNISSKAFAGTPFFNDRAYSIIELGSVLVHYGLDDTSYVIGDHIKTIGKSAFISENLEKLVIPSSVTTISEGALFCCPNLTQIYLESKNPPTVYDNSFPIFNDLKIFVPQAAIAKYFDDPNFALYTNNLFFNQQTITLLNLEGDFLTEITVDYYSAITNLPNLSNQGSSVIGWVCLEDGQVYNNGVILKCFHEDITLYPITANTNQILYVNFNDESTVEEFKYINIVLGEIATLPIPVQLGYNFIGWKLIYDDLFITDQNGEMIQPWNFETQIILVAEFELREYNIGYITDGGILPSDAINLYTPLDTFILPIPYKEGYKFLGWYCDGEYIDVIEKYTQEDFILEARWEGTNYSFDSNTFSLYIDAPYSILDFNSIIPNHYLEIHIASSVIELTIFNSTIITVNVSLIIDYREDDLLIRIDNLKIKAPNNKNAIKGDLGDYILTLDMDNSYLEGGRGVTSDKEEILNGMDAIKAVNLVIKGSHIDIIGGTGGNGIDGLDEGFEDDIDGKDGGTGGYAISAQSLSIQATNWFLKGGNGGHGGDGGTGRNSSLSDPTPGKGGTAGAGGKGQNATNLGDGYQSFGKNGFSGNPGAGGYGLTGDRGETGDIKPIDDHIRFNLNCQIDFFNLQIPFINNTYNLELIVECTGKYFFEFLSENPSVYRLVNGEKVLINLVQEGTSRIFYLDLTKGTHFLYIEFDTKPFLSSFLNIKSTSSNVKTITNNQTVDCLTHNHNGTMTFAYNSNSNSLVKISLNAILKGYGNYYFDGAITVSNNNQILQRFDLFDAISSNKSSSLVFNAQSNQTYYITISLLTDKFESASISISNIELTPISQKLNEDLTAKEETENIEFGDQLVHIKNSYPLKLRIEVEYVGDIYSDTAFVIINYSGQIIEYLKFDLLHLKSSHIITLNPNDRFYYGYINGSGRGRITYKLTALITDQFNLEIDPQSAAQVGTEVSVNGGLYGGNVMTVGFTRLCYVTLSKYNTSRLNYYWFSSDESVATVTEYGTVIAHKEGEVVISAYYKGNYSVVGIATITVLPKTIVDSIYLDYGMDVRTGGTITGSEVSSGQGQPIPVSSNPDVTIHLGYTRLICLGADSPSSSIQNFEWSSSNTNIATVSAFGTVVAVGKGTVTITGVYKTNSSYKVVIEITVI